MRGVFVELRNRVEDREARARCTFSVIIVGLGIAEECHHTVAEVLGDMPAEALDGLRRRAMVLADDLPPLFRIKLRRESG